MQQRNSFSSTSFKMENTSGTFNNHSSDQVQQLQGNLLVLKKQIDKLNDQNLQLECDKQNLREISIKSMEENKALISENSYLKIDILNIESQYSKIIEENRALRQENNELKSKNMNGENPVMILPSSQATNLCGWSKVVGSKKSDQNTADNNVNQINTLESAVIQVPVSGTHVFNNLKKELEKKFGDKITMEHWFRIYLARIYPDDAKTSYQILKYLKIHDYSIDKNKYWILRGLEERKDEKIICKELIRRGFPKDTTVKEHVTSFQTNNPEIRCKILYLVATSQALEESLRKISEFFGFEIVLQKYIHIHPVYIEA